MYGIFMAYSLSFQMLERIQKSNGKYAAVDNTEK